MRYAGDATALDRRPIWSRFEPGGGEAGTRASPASIHGEALPAWEPSIYRPSRRGRPVALAGSLLVVGGLLSALAWINVSPVFKAKHELVMVDLTATPPPPPPRQPPVPPTHQTASKAVQPPIVAPPSIVATPATPTLATSPLPSPLPTRITVPAAPAAVAGPAPAPAAAPTDAGDLSSTMISAKAPTYPLDSRRKHEEGTVVLKVVLGTDGQVSDISVSRGSGSDRLDQAALSAVRKWRWKPVVRNGEAVMVEGMVTIPFVLTH